MELFPFDSSRRLWSQIIEDPRNARHRLYITHYFLQYLRREIRWGWKYISIQMAQVGRTDWNVNQGLVVSLIGRTNSFVLNNPIVKIYFWKLFKNPVCKLELGSPDHFRNFCSKLYQTVQSNFLSKTELYFDVEKEVQSIFFRKLFKSPACNNLLDSPDHFHSFPLHLSNSQRCSEQNRSSRPNSDLINEESHSNFFRKLFKNQPKLV